MYVCACTHVYKCALYMNMHMHVCTCVLTKLCAYVYKHMYACMPVLACVHVCEHGGAHVCVCLHMHMSMVGGLCMPGACICKCMWSAFMEVCLSLCVNCMYVLVCLMYEISTHAQIHEMIHQEESTSQVK